MVVAGDWGSLENGSRWRLRREALENGRFLWSLQRCDAKVLAAKRNSIFMHLLVDVLRK